MKKQILFTFLLILVVVLAGCAKSVAEVKSDEYLGETVAVSGTVTNTLKIGELSGYTLVDSKGDEIGVASKRLPAEGDEITARGVLEKSILLGYYIDVDKE